MRERSLVPFAALSAAAATITIGLKLLAWRLTGSVGLLSDALESLINLLTAALTAAALAVAARPADEKHPHGHSKLEYMSSGAVGAVTLLAAATIAYSAIRRLIESAPVEQAGLGAVFAGVASLVNLGVAQVLRWAAKRYRSVALEAESAHLMADVWTSAAAIGGLLAVAWSGILWLDPVVALLIAANIARGGVQLLWRSAHGLLDVSLPEAELARIRAVLARYAEMGVQYHALRTREAAARRFISLHVLVPGDWSVQRGHDLLERIEADLRAAVPGAVVLTHLEPLEEPCSWSDEPLERTDPPPGRASPKSR